MNLRQHFSLQNIQSDTPSFLTLKLIDKQNFSELFIKRKAKIKTKFLKDFDHNFEHLELSNNLFPFADFLQSFVRIQTDDIFWRTPGLKFHADLRFFQDVSYLSQSRLKLLSANCTSHVVFLQQHH